MRPSLTTLAGMTLAVGSIAAVGAGIAAGSTASAQAEPAPITTTVDVAPIDLGPLVRVAQTEPRPLEPTPVDAEAEFTDESYDGSIDWFDGDDCPPCGMG